MGLIAFSFPLSFPPLSLCRWRRPRLISNLLDGLVHSNFPSNVPDWSPQRFARCTCIHCVSLRGIIYPSKKIFYFFRLLLRMHSSCSMKRIPWFDYCYCYRKDDTYVSWNKKMRYGIYYSRNVARAAFENILFIIRV